MGEAVSAGVTGDDQLVACVADHVIAGRTAEHGSPRNGGQFDYSGFHR